MPYLVCHMEKYKRQEVSPVEMENERDENYKASNPQIDSARTKNNYHLISPRESYIEMINARLATLSLKRKIRSDAIYMNSFVLGSDGEFSEDLQIGSGTISFGIVICSLQRNTATRISSLRSFTWTKLTLIST